LTLTPFFASPAAQYGGSSACTIIILRLKAATAISANMKTTDRTLLMTYVIISGYLNSIHRDYSQVDGSIMFRDLVIGI